MTGWEVFVAVAQGTVLYVTVVAFPRDMVGFLIGLATYIVSAPIIRHVGGIDGVGGFAYGAVVLGSSFLLIVAHNVIRARRRAR